MTTTIEQASKLSNEELQRLSYNEKQSIKKDRTTLDGYTKGIIIDVEHKRIIDALNSKSDAKAGKAGKAGDKDYTSTKQPQPAKKYRYVRTDIEKQITHLSFVAKAVYNNILISHDTNSLGIFIYNINQKAGYFGITTDMLIEALNELQDTGYVRYKDGYVFHNSFIKDQKSNGNDDNKRGAVKLYNALPVSIKLPFIDELELATATTQQVNERYNQLAKAIPAMGLFVSKLELSNSFKKDLVDAFGEADADSILLNGYTSLSETIKVENFRSNLKRNPIVAIDVVDAIDGNEPKQEVTPIEVIQQPVTIEDPEVTIEPLTVEVTPQQVEQVTQEQDPEVAPIEVTSQEDPTQELSERDLIGYATDIMTLISEKEIDYASVYALYQNTPTAPIFEKIKQEFWMHSKVDTNLMAQEIKNKLINKEANNEPTTK